MVGVEILTCEPEMLTGRVLVIEALIAGTGFFLTLVINTLAVRLRAAGIGLDIPEGAGFTMIEMKSNFLGTVREGALSTARRGPFIATAPRRCGTLKSETKRPNVSFPFFAARR